MKSNNKTTITNNPPLISVIIPVYNRKNMIVETINSALSQTYPQIEVVVVDDCSDDGTFDLLMEHGNAIVICRNHRNMGQSAARNRGIEVSKGEYVFFLDSDDSLEPDALKILWSALSSAQEEDEIWGASYGKRLTCDENLNPVKVKEKKYYSGNILPYALQDSIVRTGTWLVRKSILKEMGGFREDLAAGEDMLLVSLIACKYRFLFVDKYISKYRRHEGVRARNNVRGILNQGTRHLDLFYKEHPAVAPESKRIKKRLYADEHLQLCGLSWHSNLPEHYLFHWREALRYRRFFEYHPKYSIRALLSMMKKKLKSS